ncbi:hypothetical protein [Chryseobacterium gambrini]|uniref:hypothetical protein n=1 Tax=Chryseobacterium gambrini TaxID=373672 RepID=UPI003D11A6AC
MSKFKELQEKMPKVAKKLVKMSKDEMIERLSELEMYKDDNDFFEKELEHIVNLGLDWLRSNKKNNHYIHIEKDYVKLAQKEIIETEFI